MSANMHPNRLASCRPGPGPRGQRDSPGGSDGPDGPVPGGCAGGGAGSAEDWDGESRETCILVVQNLRVLSESRRK